MALSVQKNALNLKESNCFYCCPPQSDQQGGPKVLALHSEKFKDPHLPQAQSVRHSSDLSSVYNTHH